MVYIKNLKQKRRAWDGGPSAGGGGTTSVWQTSAEVRKAVESSPSFKAVEREMNEAAASARQKFVDDKEGNAAQQRWRTLSADDKAEACIDKLTATIKTHGDMGINQCDTHEKAAKKASEIAVRFDKEQK